MFDQTLPSVLTQQVRGTYSPVLFAYRQPIKQHNSHHNVETVMKKTTVIQPAACS